MKIILSILNLLLISNILLAQEEIKGQVYLKLNEDLIPISGVNVYWLDTSKGTISNKDGKFSIPNVPDGTYEAIAWQERFGSKRTLSQQVTVKGGSATLNFNFERPKKK